MNVGESKYKNLKECKLNFKVATQENKCSNLREKEEASKELNRKESPRSSVGYK